MIPAIAHAGGLLTSPLVISGCRLWLDAADASSITNSPRPTQWNDKSGNAFHVTAAAASTARPTYSTAVQNGRNAMSFDGSANVMGVDSKAVLSSLAAWTIFAAVKTSSNNTAQTIISLGTTFIVGNTLAQLVTLVTSGFRRIGGRRLDADSFAVAAGSTQTSTSWCQWCGIGNYTATTATLFVNGTQDAINSSCLSAGSTTSDQTSLHIGAGVDNGSAFWNGYIGEIIIYGSALSTSDRIRVQNYLKAKWGL